MIKIDLTPNVPPVGEFPIGPPISQFELTVPLDYLTDGYVDSLVKRVKLERSNYNTAFSEEFIRCCSSGPTNVLIPGETYIVRMFPLFSASTFNDYTLWLLRHPGVLLVGGRGLILVYDLKKDQLPKSRVTVAPDIKQRLYTNGSECHLPMVGVYSGNRFLFESESIEIQLGPEHCVMAFFKKK